MTKNFIINTFNDSQDSGFGFGKSGVFSDIQFENAFRNDRIYLNQ
jgi:hypothetical protein